MHSFDECPGYHALSYAWGSTAEPNLKKISVNNGTLRITTNLWDFLLVLQSSSTGVTWFWADQISINQEYTQERNHQVSLMGEIYSRAQEVYAWLGAMTTFPLRDSAWDQKHVQFLYMATQEYWQRLWIVQELSLAKEVRIFSRFETITLFDFARSLRDFTDTWWPQDDCEEITVQRYNVYGIHRKTIMMLSDASFTPQYQRSIELATALIQHASQLCSDPRDKVFGLQSLVLPSQRVKPDHGSTLHYVNRTALWNAIVLRPAEEVMYSNWSLANLGSIGIVHETRLRAYRFLDTITSSMQLPPLDAHTLLWAHIVPKLPSDLRAMKDVTISLGNEVHIRNFMFSGWDVMWTKLEEISTTPRQKLVAKDFLEVSRTYDEFAKLPEDKVKVINRVAEVVTLIISEIGTRHGFFMYGECLRHPDDNWPFPEETRVSISDYFHEKRRDAGSASDECPVKPRAMGSWGPRDFTSSAGFQDSRRDRTEMRVISSWGSTLTMD